MRAQAPAGHLAHAIDGLLSIDHIGVFAGHDGFGRENGVAAREDRRLSDHDAYVVEFA